jgi:hypothetical protein
MAAQWQPLSFPPEPKMGAKLLAATGVVLAAVSTQVLAENGYLQDDELVTTVSGRMAHRCVYQLIGDDGETAVILPDTCPNVMDFE